VEDVGQGLDRQRLGETGDALEQKVTAREQGDEHPLEHRVLAHDHPADLVQDGLGGSPRVDGVVHAVAGRRWRAGGGRPARGGRTPVAGAAGAIASRRLAAQRIAHTGLRTRGHGP